MLQGKKVIVTGAASTAPPEVVVTVNLVALKRLTLGLVDSLADNAFIVNLASLAGIGWEGEVPRIQAAANLGHADVGAFCEANDIT